MSSNKQKQSGWDLTHMEQLVNGFLHNEVDAAKFVKNSENEEENKKLKQEIKFLKKRNSALARENNQLKKEIDQIKKDFDRFNLLDLD